MLRSGRSPRPVVIVRNKNAPRRVIPAGCFLFAYNDRFAIMRMYRVIPDAGSQNLLNKITPTGLEGCDISE